MVVLEKRKVYYKYMDERLYWLALSTCNGIGPAKFSLLLEQFWTAENAWNATALELEHCGIGSRSAEKLINHRLHFDVTHYAGKLASLGIWFVTKNDQMYPQLLKDIRNAPNVLYGKGSVELLSHPVPFAVVGTRRITEYGKQVTETLTQELSMAGCCIVSGLAMGVDAVAHATALQSGGKTIAVLGGGVETCTPQENAWLYERMLAKECTVISEAPPGQEPTRGSFPARNRIIAGMSKGVLVTEGAEDSGSLITAHDALHYGRPVFAIPGPITSSVSKGPIALITKGAVMTVSANDILQVLSLKAVKKRKMIRDASKDEEKILDVLQDDHVSFDEIVKRTGFQSSQVGIMLSLMEMKGWITTADSGQFLLVEN